VLALQIIVAIGIDTNEEIVTVTVCRPTGDVIAIEIDAPTSRGGCPRIHPLE